MEFSKRRTIPIKKENKDNKRKDNKKEINLKIFQS